MRRRITISIYYFAGQARSYNWFEDEDERRSTELGQGVQTAPGPEEG